MTFKLPKPRSKLHAKILAEMQAEMDELNKDLPPDLQYASPPGTNPRTWWGEALELSKVKE